MGTSEASVTAHRSLGDVADSFPQSIGVFENAGIDYSCRGARSLADAAAAAGYRTDELIHLIEEAPRPADAVEWARRPLEELARFLERDHSVAATTMMPALRKTLEEIADRHPDLVHLRRIASLFAAFASAVTLHMAHEERDLFASLMLNDSTSRLSHARLSQRVLHELVEHEVFREQLRTMRELCMMMHDECKDDVFAKLDEFSRALHFHMHLENNILYPRAIDLENQLRRATDVERSRLPPDSGPRPS